MDEFITYHEKTKSLKKRKHSDNEKNFYEEKMSIILELRELSIEIKKTIKEVEDIMDCD
tara:strand:+ start:86 stop:262 length:177 start_codon:yes stop_codon:yes gene_type:complete